MEYPGFKSQLDTLVNRQLAIMAGSVSNIFILLLQAPIIGYFIGLGWENHKAQPTTFFIMSVAALWLGCMNASCTIVKERPIFQRERMFHLSIPAYLLSKIGVLSVVTGLQSLLLLFVQSQMMELSKDIIVLLLYFLFMFLTGISATGLGLLISACSRTTYFAVMAVPIILIPQVIFSEVLLQNHIDRHLPALCEKFTLTKWCYDALMAIGSGLDTVEWDLLGLSALALIFSLVVFLLLAALKLKMDDI